MALARSGMPRNWGSVIFGGEGGEIATRVVAPAWALVGAAAVAWNPLVLLDSVQNAQNDIVMVFFLLAYYV